MSVAVDTRNAGTKGAGVTSINWNHTVNSGLSNSIITVGAGVAASPSPPAITTLTYNTTALSNSINGTTASTTDTHLGFAAGSLWFLKAPAAGTLQIIVGTAGSCEMTAGSASYQGVDQTTPFNASSPQLQGRGIGVNPTITVTSATGEMCLDYVAYLINGAAPTVAVGAGQTQVALQDNGANTSGGGMSDQGGAATVVMDWTGLDQTTDDGTAQAAVSLKAAAGGGSVSLPPLVYGDLNGVGSPGRFYKDITA